MRKHEYFLKADRGFCFFSEFTANRNDRRQLYGQNFEVADTDCRKTRDPPRTIG